MIALRSLLFNVVFFTWTALVLVISVPLLLWPYRAMVRAAHIWAKGSLAILAGLCGLRHEIRGREHLPDGPCIIAAKHQSAWETLIFNVIVDAPGFVFKRELLWVPLFGWHVRHAGSIPIDRKRGARALRTMLDAARRVLDQGRKIIIFPEGTRVPPGQHKSYHPGVAALYSQLGVPVVPVAVNSGLYWGRRTFVKRPGRIVLEILPPIAPGLSRGDFTAELEQRLETASRRLLADERGQTDIR